MPCRYGLREYGRSDELLFPQKRPCVVGIEVDRGEMDSRGSGTSSRWSVASVEKLSWMIGQQGNHMSVS